MRPCGVVCVWLTACAGLPDRQRLGPVSSRAVAGDGTVYAGSQAGILEQGKARAPRLAAECLAFAADGATRLVRRWHRLGAPVQALATAARGFYAGLADGIEAEAFQALCLKVALESIEEDSRVVGAFLWKWFPHPRSGGRDFQLATLLLAATIAGVWR